VAITRNLPEIWPILKDGILGQDAAKVRERIDHAVSADQGTGINHGIASNLDSITDNCAELAKTCRDSGVFVMYRDFFSIQTEIGKDYSSAQMSLVPEDRIAHVTEMGNLHVIEDQAILELAGIAQNNFVADDDVFPKITARPKVAFFADPGWTFNRYARFDHGTFSDEDRVANE
jgi:hypothetical protein